MLKTTEKIAIISIIFISFICLTDLVEADIIYLKTGQKIEGHIEEEDSGVVKVVTVLGEVELDKERIKDIEYSEPLSNYFNLAEAFLREKKFKRAIDYYNKVLQINPDFKEAKEGLIKAEKALKENIKYLERIKKREIAERKRLKQKKLKELTSLRENVAKDLGMILGKTDEGYQIQEVVIASRAYLADLKKNDIIVEINNREARNLSENEILSALLKDERINLTISRRLNIETNSFVYNNRGVNGIGVFIIKDNDNNVIVDQVIENTPAYLSNIKAGDYFVSVCGKSTKDFSLEDISNLIQREDRVNVDILRKIELRK